jgi:tetratricopeptide (TPR) repeat protein
MLSGPFGGLDARMARFRTGSLMYPQAMGVSGGLPSADQRQAFQQYGGFGPRPLSEAQPGDVSDALRRRYGLIQATTQTAPVARANYAYASVAGLRSMHDRAILRPVEPGPFDSVEPPDVSASTLTEELVRGVDLTLGIRKQQAWAYFREGDYRKAARTLEAVAVLDRDDMESRIGEMFAYVSHGSTRKAIALLGEFARRAPDPFSINVNMAERYGRREEVLRLTLQARAQASAGRESPPLIALSTLIFWYAGDREEARSTAVGLRTIGRGTVFESWPAKLEAAHAARQNR